MAAWEMIWDQERQTNVFLIGWLQVAEASAVYYSATLFSHISFLSTSAVK